MKFLSLPCHNYNFWNDLGFLFCFDFFFNVLVAKPVKSLFSLDFNFFFLSFCPVQQYGFLQDNYFLVRKSYLLHILFNLKTNWDFRLVLKFSILSYTWVHFDWYRYKVHVTIQGKHYRLMERKLSSVSPCTWSEMNFQIKMCISFLLFDRE